MHARRWPVGGRRPQRLGAARPVRNPRPARCRAGRPGRTDIDMELLSWIVVGAIAGFLASLLTGSREGLLWMIVLGIVGALVGGYVARNVLKVGSVTGINAESILIATVGAIAIILIARFASGSRRLGRMN